MSVPSRRMGLRRLVECAVLIAIGTVLSLFEFSGPWALGGGITVCSMLPLVLICHRHGTKWGISSALVYGVLQMAVALSIPILLRYNGQRGASPRWNTAMKWLFYLYYPAHLFLIGWLQWRA